MKDGADTLIPPAEFPGRAEASVAASLDRQHYRKFQQLYREGLAAIGTDFVALAPERRGDLIRQIERSHPRFFAKLLSRSMHGFYWDPRCKAQRSPRPSSA
jgi:hypothetical protein